MDNIREFMDAQLRAQVESLQKENEELRKVNKDLCSKIALAEFNPEDTEKLELRQEVQKLRRALAIRDCEISQLREKAMVVETELKKAKEAIQIAERKTKGIEKGLTGQRLAVASGEVKLSQRRDEITPELIEDLLGSGLSITQISQRLGVSRGTVYNRKAEGQKLRQGK